MVVVMDDLDLDSELIELCLHQLLSDLGQKFQVRLNVSTFHDFLALLNILIFTLFNDLPEFIRKNISSLVQLFFG